MSVQKQSFNEIISDVEALLAHERLKKHCKNAALKELIKLIQEFRKSWMKPVVAYSNATAWEASYKELKNIQIENDTDLCFVLTLYVFLQILNLDHCYQASDFYHYIDDYLQPVERAYILALPKHLQEALKSYRLSASFLQELIAEIQPSVIHKTLLSLHARELLKGTVETDNTVLSDFVLFDYQLIKCSKNESLEDSQIGLYVENNQIQCHFKSLLGNPQVGFILSLPVDRFSVDNFLEQDKAVILSQLQKAKRIHFLTSDQSSLFLKLEGLESILNIEVQRIEDSRYYKGILSGLWNWWEPIIVDEAKLDQIRESYIQLQAKYSKLKTHLFFINYLFEHAFNLIYQQDLKLKDLIKTEGHYVRQKNILDELHNFLKIYQGITSKISELILEISNVSCLSDGLIELISNLDPTKKVVGDEPQSFRVSEYKTKLTDILKDLTETNLQLTQNFEIFNTDKTNYLTKLASIKFIQTQNNSLIKYILKMALGFSLVTVSVLGLVYAETLLPLLLIEISLSLFQSLLALAFAASLGYVFVVYKDNQSCHAEMAPSPNNSCALLTTR